MNEKAFNAGVVVRNTVATGAVKTKDAAKATSSVATSFLRGLLNKPAKAAQ